MTPTTLVMAYYENAGMLAKQFDMPSVQLVTCQAARPALALSSWMMAAPKAPAKPEDLERRAAANLPHHG
jgi:hypothetical protein